MCMLCMVAVLVSFIYLIFVYDFYFYFSNDKNLLFTLLNIKDYVSYCRINSNDL